jgi:hypothetical protein
MADNSWKANPWVWVISFKVLSTTGRQGVSEVERPILFSTDMVEALLSGRKTMTRRVVKPQIDGYCNWHSPKLIPCPFGNVGDILWVRENFRYSQPYGSESLHYQYMDGTNGEPVLTCNLYLITNYDRTRPSIHMPKVAARIWLQITDIRVERLQDISESDAGNEGVAFSEGVPVRTYRDYQLPSSIWTQPFTAVDSFRSLWESINNTKGASHG